MDDVNRVPGASRWADDVRDNPLLFAGCLTLLAFGCYLRLQDLGFPGRLLMDEHHFVRNARNYLMGKADWNDHPPLGKLLIAAAMQLFGDRPAIWRLVPLIAGLGSVALAYPLGMLLFRQRTAAWVAVAVLAADGFLLTYSRSALLDGLLTFFMLATLLLAIRARNLGGMLAASAVAGLAASIKISGVVCLVPLVVYCVVNGKRHWLLTLFAMPAVFYAQWAIGLSLSGRGGTPADVWEQLVVQVDHHSGLTQMAHPMVSRWYAWLLGIKPFILGQQNIGDGLIRVRIGIGNPLLWGGSSVLMIWATWRQLWVGLGASLRELTAPTSEARGSFATEHGAAIATLTMMWWLPLMPWVLTLRDPYLYHYLPSYSFALLLLSGLLAWLYRHRPRGGLLLLAAVAAVSFYYAPVWGGLPITAEGLENRLFLPLWR